MDIDILVWLAERRTPFFDRLFSFITLFGGEIVIITIACLTYWCVSKRAGDRLLFTLFSGIMLNQFLKLTFCVKRPFVRTDRYKPVESALGAATGYSFPSGHTANAVAGYGGLAREKRLARAKWALWAFAALVGFSRLYLGVHTITDVIASYILGVLLVLLIDKACEHLEREPEQDKYFALLGAVGGVLLAIYALTKSYPDSESVDFSADALKLAGGAVGVFSGWLAERRLIGFQKPASLWRALLRAAGGMALVVIIMIALKGPFIKVMGTAFGGFTRYALMGLTATVVWPYIFTKAGF